jgi:hypothetical protein
VTFQLVLSHPSNRTTSVYSHTSSLAALSSKLTLATPIPTAAKQPPTVAATTVRTALAVLE